MVDKINYESCNLYILFKMITLIKRTKSNNIIIVLKEAFDLISKSSKIFLNNNSNYNILLTAEWGF